MTNKIYKKFVNPRLICMYIKVVGNEARKGGKSQRAFINFCTALFMTIYLQIHPSIHPSIIYHILIF